MPVGALVVTSSKVRPALHGGHSPSWEYHLPSVEGIGCFPVRDKHGRGSALYSDSSLQSGWGFRKRFPAFASVTGRIDGSRTIQSERLHVKLVSTSGSAATVALMDAKLVPNAELPPDKVSVSSTSPAECGKKGQVVDPPGTLISPFAQQLNYGKLLFAGAMSAVVSRTFVAPLERVKMDMVLKNSQADALNTALQVYKKEGVLGFWKGNALNVLRTAPFKALNFFSFDMYRKSLANMGIVDQNLERFVAGACAGVTATMVCFPLDVLRTRLMAATPHRYGGIWKTLTGILRYEGVGALYAGCGPAIVGMAPAGAVFYGVYDLLKMHHLESGTLQDGSSSTGTGKVDLPGQYVLLYGAAAGAMSEMIVYPLEVIRRRMQLQSMAYAAALAGSRSTSRMAGGHAAGAASSATSALLVSGGYAPDGWSRFSAACVSIVRADGFRGFYAGLLPNMLQVLPSAALSYWTYETVKKLLNAQQ